MKSKRLSPKYSVIVMYEDFDTNFDRTLEKAAGRDSSGSGFGICGRDLSFDFYKQDAAERALKRLRKFRKYKCKAKLEVIPDEDRYYQ